jgi:hypothetical protein
MGFMDGEWTLDSLQHGVISYIDDNAFLKHLLAPLERETQNVFSGIVCSFAHLPAVYK